MSAPRKRSQAEREAEEEEYVALLERFREWCAGKEISFQTGMTRAIAKLMNQKPRRPPPMTHKKIDRPYRNWRS